MKLVEEAVDAITNHRGLFDAIVSTLTEDEMMTNGMVAELAAEHGFKGLRMF